MEETRALLAQYNLAATVRSHGSPGSQYSFMVVSLPVPLWEADKLCSSALQDHCSTWPRGLVQLLGPHASA